MVVLFTCIARCNYLWLSTLNYNTVRPSVVPCSSTYRLLSACRVAMSTDWISDPRRALARRSAVIGELV